jgi:hypothetical protein
MTLMIGLHHFFLEMSKKCWPTFRVRNNSRHFLFNKILLQNTNMEDNQDNLLVKFFHWTLPALDTFSNLN